MVTRYDVISTRWSSKFWVKIHVFFKLLLTIKLYLVARIMQSAYFCVIQENRSDQEKLFKIWKQLFNQSFEVPFPPHVSKSMLANVMANFFVEKISNIRSKFHECTIQDCQDCSPIMELHSPSFGRFKAITEDETYSIIMKLAKNSCALDPIPTPLLVKCINVL